MEAALPAAAILQRSKIESVLAIATGPLSVEQAAGHAPDAAGEAGGLPWMILRRIFPIPFWNGRIGDPTDSQGGCWADFRWLKLCKPVWP